MSDVAVRVEGMGKRYRVGGDPAAYGTFRDTVAAAARAPLRRLSGGAFLGSEFWALRDASFEVRRGEVLGIIGRNGAGKSTLLKILSRITEPTTGRAEIQGRVGSLLEVGTGFHPELTGRENIFLNGAILGMSRRDIARRFNEIVEFAEVQRFLDTPVKRYSSGMYTRLAFSVAAHLEPDILVVDEVLAVGDAQFQTKSLGKMGDVARQGRTVLFVSHNLAAVTNLCHRVLLLDHGHLVLEGTPSQCVDHYLSRGGPTNSGAWESDWTDRSRPLALRRVSAVLEGQQPHHLLSIDVVMETCAAHRRAFVAVDIVAANGTTIMQAEPRAVGFIEDSFPKHDLQIKILLPPLTPGTYSCSIWTGTHHVETLDFVERCVSFVVAEYPNKDRTYQYTPQDHGYVVPESSVSHHVDVIDWT